MTNKQLLESYGYHFQQIVKHGEKIADFLTSIIEPVIPSVEVYYDSVTLSFYILCTDDSRSEPENGRDHLLEFLIKDLINGVTVEPSLYILASPVYVTDAEANDIRRIFMENIDREHRG